MTNEEAIKRLEEAYYNSDYMREPIQMAIEALRNERPKDDNLCNTCKKYYECSNSSKIAPNFYVTKCCRYEGGRQ